MGVMNCSRKDCSSIMCHTHISGVGYICSDCQTEFKNFLCKQLKVCMNRIMVKK